MLQQLFGGAAGEFKVVAGVITDEFIEADNELTKLRKNLEQIPGQEGNLEILEQTIRSYNELAVVSRGIYEQEVKALQTVKDYEAAIADAKESLNENFQVYEDTAAALLELIALQSRADSTGAGALYDQIAEKFGIKAAATFQGDLDKALVGSISELEARLKGMGFGISNQIIDIETLKGILKDMQVELDLQQTQLKIKELKVERIQAAEAAVTQIAGIATTFGQGDIFGGLAAAGRATGTPQGALAGAVFEGMSQFAALGEMATDSSVQAVAEEIVKSAEMSIENFEKGIEIFAEVLPDIITLIMTELPIAIVKAAPSITLAIFEGTRLALMEILGWLHAAWDSLVDFFRGRTREERQADRQDFIQSVKDAFTGFQDRLTASYEEGYESYNSGTGYVSRTGLAMLHQGESVVPVNGRPQQGAMGAGAPVNINISASMIDRDVIPRLVRDIEKVTGRFGRMQASFA